MDRPRYSILPHGFTLIELLTVIAIIGILMALLLGAIHVIRERANRARAKTDVTAIVTAVKNYHLACPAPKETGSSSKALRYRTTSSRGSEA